MALWLIPDGGGEDEEFQQAGDVAGKEMLYPSKDAELPDAGGPGAAEGLRYEPNPKHPPSGTVEPGTRRVAPQPTNPEPALSISVPFKSNKPDRVAIDPETGEFIIFRQHDPGIYHGYAVTWKQLNQEQKNALIETGQVTLSGKIK